MNYSALILLLSFVSFESTVFASLLKRSKTIDSDFLKACKEGDYDEVKRYLDDGSSASESDNIGSALCYAIESSEDCRLVKLLLEKGADVDEGTVERGYTPLIVAIECGFIECVELLLEYGAKINKKTESGHTALHAAAQKGSVKICKKLLVYNVSLSEKTNGGCTPLMLALYHNNMAVAQLLLKEGAHLNIEHVLERLSKEELAAIITQLIPFLKDSDVLSGE